MKDRITNFLLEENISPAEFADKIGVQRSSISHVLNGRNQPSASFIQKILAAYPNLNPRWLLLGDGTMTSSKAPVAAPSLFDANKTAAEPEQKVIKQPKPEEKNVDVTKEIAQGSLSENIVLPKETVVSNDTTHRSESLNNTDNKEIDKIIILYRDKTFTMYNPS